VGKRSKPRVVFDADIFSAQVHGGVSRYYAELIPRLDHFGVETRLVVPLSVNEHLQLRPPHVWGVRLPERMLTRVTQRAARLASKLSDQVVPRLLRPDILHQTLYCNHYPQSWKRAVTVVDMIPEILPQDVTPGAHKGKREACQAASLIFTISHKTREDLLRIYPDLMCPVEVTPLAVDAALYHQHARGQEDDQILFVGNRRGYKNFKTFAEATSRLLQQRPELSVLCVGGGPFTDDELRPFRETGTEARCRRATVRDVELPSLYRKSKAFVFPSRYEGFGLPILESFAARCPAVISRASCFPEIADEAAAYFDPESSDDLFHVLSRIVADKQRRDELRELGSKRLTHFSWERTAELTRDGYMKIL
jgi:glycosyltransferase involved in cell wall biosynthesis